MDYLATTATLTLAVTGYAANDYCVFYGNLGSGAIDYDTPVSIEFNLYGETSIVFVYDTHTPGTYEFGAVAYDTYENASDATEDDTMYIDCEPREPEPMTYNAYDSGTDQLTLNLN